MALDFAQTAIMNVIAVLKLHFTIKYNINHPCMSVIMNNVFNFL